MKKVLFCLLFAGLAHHGDPGAEPLPLEHTDAGAAPMSEEALERFARAYTAAWNSGDPGQVANHYAPDGSLTINGGEPSEGRDAIAGVAESFMTGFPDMVLTFDGLEFEDGRVLYHWTFRGTNSGPGGTGNSVDFSGFESWVFDENGLVQHSLGSFDETEYRRQLESGVDRDQASSGIFPQMRTETAGLSRAPGG